nr:hypothetical protein Iba_chr02dCG12830 [Ipomoea batatas]
MIPFTHAPFPPVTLRRFSSNQQALVVFSPCFFPSHRSAGRVSSALLTAFHNLDVEDRFLAKGFKIFARDKMEIKMFHQTVQIHSKNC